MKSIVAVDKNWGIGRDGKLLTYLPEDMKFFRTTTKGKTVIMGRKTLESFPGGEPLKNRVNIVLTGNESYRPEGCVVCHTPEEVLEAAKAYDTEDVFIIGGQSVYEQFLPYCDTAYVTYMKADFSPDTWYVNLEDKKEWQLAQISEEKEYEGLSFEFRTYRRTDGNGGGL